MLGAVALLLYLSRHVTFYLDEWRLVTQRRTWDVGTFLRPHNEHLFLVPIAVFKVLMATVGLRHHWVYELPLVFLHLVCVVLVYLLVERRLGAWLALAASALILFLGSAWEDLLLPIQISFLGSIAAGLGMLLVFDHHPTRLRDSAASLLLVLSIASSTLGLSFAAAALVEILGRDRARRRLWIVGMPLVLYAVWFVAYGPRRLQQNGSVQTNLPFVPKYVAEAAAGAFGAVSGLGLDWGRLFAILALAVIVNRFLSKGQVPLRLLSVLAAALSFWLLSALARAQLNDPAAVRYLYPGAVFLVLLGIELLRPHWRDPRVAALVAAGVGLAVLANLNELRGGRDTLRDFSDTVRAQLAALEVAGEKHVSPQFHPAPGLAPSLTARAYFDTVRDLGSPIDLRRDLLQQSNIHRQEGDAVLIRALRLMARPGGSVDALAHSPSVDDVRSGVTSTAGPCVGFQPTGAHAALDITPLGSAVVARADGVAAVSFRRFGDQFGGDVTIIGPSTEVIRLPPANPPTPWHLRISTSQRVQVCTGADATGP
jgi:hypothetical protein